MAVFLGMAGVMITGWASMFASRTFLWTFRSWRFFAFMTVAAAVLLAAAISLGVACRLNFGKGLPEYREFMATLYTLFAAHHADLYLSCPRRAWRRTRVGAGYGEVLR